MTELENNLEAKKYKLEILKVVFSVLTPLLVLSMGIILNRKLEEQKSALQHADLKQKKIDLMQKIVPQLFDTNNTKTLAMMLLMKDIDSVIANDIQVIIIKNYSAAKNTKDSIQANSMLNAAKSFGGPLVDSLKKINSKFENAANMEKKGFNFLLDNNIQSAIEAFDKAEQIYPSYHNAHEISKFLNNNKEMDINSIKKTIKEKYSWGAPKEIIDKY